MTLTVCKRTPSQLDAGWYRSHVGVVSQEPRLFASTVAANISYGCQGLNDVSRADVEHAAKLSNAYDFIMKLPQGFDTPVTDKRELWLSLHWSSWDP